MVAVSALGSWVQVHPLEADERLLWDPRTGRGLRLHADTLAALDSPRLAPVRQRLRRAGLLAEAAPDLATWLPVRTRLAFLLPERPALWRAHPGTRGAGGHGWSALPLSAPAARLWAALDDRSPLRQAAERAGLDLSEAFALIAPWMTLDAQLLQLRERAPLPADPTLERFVEPARALAPRTPDQRGAAGETTLTDYHLHHITHPPTHFDDRETTVAHALALGHAGLGGRAYGEALREALRAQGRLPSEGLAVEIGCGTGELAASFTRGGPAALKWLRADLSPALLAHQATTAPHTAGLLADGTRLPLRDAVADLIVSNEVIADLSAVPWAPGRLDTPAEREVAALVAAYGLAADPEVRAYNLGAWQLLAEVARVLKPGGHAFVSEFGDEAEAPQEAVQLDHPEVSIHFGELAQVARALGLEATLTPLDALLGVDLRAPQVARPAWEGLRALGASLGVHLPARAFTAAEAAALLPEPVAGVAECGLDSPGPGPLITRFWALLVTKPLTPRPAAEAAIGPAA